MLKVYAEEERIGRYQLVAKIASGGMATVYLARHSGAGGFRRFVAIKRLHPHLAQENEFVEMFLDEARLAARIHHPNVVPILEIEMGNEGYFLVMEYVEGDTLGRVIAKSVQSGQLLPTKVAVRIILDALTGLHVAHELKDDEGRSLEIVHRDISPQNILVGVDGMSRITDFGVAHAVSRLSSTRTGQLKGKLAYMAPEQAQGRAVGGMIDRRADLFAMGIVLWEALTCHRLFKGEEDIETLNKLLFLPIPLARSANPKLPESLERICSRALERERNARYSTAAEFADDLEQAAQAAGLLGSSRDTAKHLQSVLGTSLADQREVVRAWVARDDSKTNHGVGDPPTELSPAQRALHQSFDRGPSELATVTSASVSIPNNLVGVSLPPGSLSRAGYSVPPSGLLGARSTRGWVLGGLAVVMLAGIPLSWAMFRMSTARVQEPPERASEVAVAAAQPATPEAGVASPPKASVPEPEVPPPAVTPTNPKTMPRPKPVGRSDVKGRSPSSPAESSSPASGSDVPEDILKNPYR